MSNKNRMICSIAFLALVTGCSVGTDGNARSSATITKTQAASTPTATKEPTLTATEAPTATITMIPVPTLDGDSASVRMKNMLENNNGCELPCFWGLTPGKSNYLEGYSILFPLSGISEISSLEDSPGTIKPVYNMGDIYIKVFIGYLFDPNAQFINSMAVLIRPWERFPDPGFEGGYGYSPVYDLPEFGKEAAFYMLPGILSRLGTPESVYILTMGKSGVEGMQYADFNLLLLYPDQGILIDYNTKKRVAGNYVLGCMANPMVEMILSPKGDRDAFFTQLIKTRFENFKENYKPLEDLTSLSLEEFYQTYSKSADKCISIPIDALPVWYP